MGEQKDGSVMGEVKVTTHQEAAREFLWRLPLALDAQGGLPLELTAPGAVLRFEGAESSPGDNPPSTVRWRAYWRLAVEGVKPDMGLVALGRDWRALEAVLREVAGGKVVRSDECPGSGKPANEFGGCCRCFAEGVRGEWVRIEPERFSVFPSFGYYVAKPHAAVERNQAAQEAGKVAGNG